MSTRSALCPVLVAVAFAAAVPGCSAGDTDANPARTTTKPASSATVPGLASLPGIDEFQQNPSDQFLIDPNEMTGGHPFKGRNAVTPHAGAHAYVSNLSGTWPQGGTGPESYPAIRAVADGIVTRVIGSARDGGNDRYGIHLAVARSGNATYEFEYRMEPMVPEPSPGFYAGFLSVAEGDRVTKGQVIGYLFVPPGDTGSHVHFALVNTATGAAMAPTIFGREVLKEFYVRWKATGFDSTEGYTNPIPPCMGWKIAADENPFGASAAECLQ